MPTAFDRALEEVLARADAQSRGFDVGDPGVGPPASSPTAATASASAAAPAAPGASPSNGVPSGVGAPTFSGFEGTGKGPGIGRGPTGVLNFGGKVAGGLLAGPLGSVPGSFLGDLINELARQFRSPVPLFAEPAPRGRGDDDPGGTPPGVPSGPGPTANDISDAAGIANGIVADNAFGPVPDLGLSLGVDPATGNDGPSGPGSDGNTSDGTGPGNTGGVGDGPAYRRGGTVKKTGPALVHKREEVVRASEASRPGVRPLLKSINKPGESPLEKKVREFEAKNGDRRI